MFARRLIQPHALLLGSVAAAMTAGNTVAANQQTSPPTSPAQQPAPQDAASVKTQSLDPDLFFAQLIERYRRMTAYQDMVSVVQLIEDGDAQPSRVESELTCELDEHGHLAVSTPVTDYRGFFNAMFPVRSSDGMDAARQQHAMWLAPHMSLRFDHSPMQRSSKAPMKPVEARTVQVEDQTVVQLRLSNRPEADKSTPVPPCLDHDAEPETTFDLYVNPESMLVERIEGDERLPDGRQQRTTVHIHPLRTESDCRSDGQWTEVGPEEAPTRRTAPTSAASRPDEQAECDQSAEHAHTPPREP